MAELVPLGPQVGVARIGRRHLQRNPLHDLQPVPLEGHVLARIVGHQTHPSHPEVPEDLGADAVVPLVRAEAELLVRLHRVVPLLLELVGQELVDQADPPLLLEQVEEDALALPLDALQGAVELVPAIAALGAEHVAGQALAVDPHQRRLLRVHPATRPGALAGQILGRREPTQGLHRLAFDMYEELAEELGCASYRKLPVLSVSPGYDGVKAAARNRDLQSILPQWLDGRVGRIGALGYGDDTAQITPSEFVDRMVEAITTHNGVHHNVVLGTCVGVESDQGSARGSRKVTAVRYRSRTTDDDDEVSTLPADVVIVAAGPWSSAAEDWFPHATGLRLPMEGIKSTSIVWKPPLDESNGQPMDVDATALFCGEDQRFGTHLEVYPRPDGTVYICGIGGSDYVSTAALKDGAFQDVCEANPTRVQAA